MWRVSGCSTLMAKEMWSSAPVLLATGKKSPPTTVRPISSGQKSSWMSRLAILRITRKTPEANFSEVAVYEYSEEAYQKRMAERAESARLQAEQEAALKQARAEALRRPLIEMAPYGTLSLVDEIICGNEPSEHSLSESAATASQHGECLGSKGARAASRHRNRRLLLLPNR